MALLDVNALVALAWDSHVHHVAVRRWLAGRTGQPLATCPLTESGFVRVSSNPRVLPAPIGIGDAITVLAAIRAIAGHTFLSDDVSLSDPDVPAIPGYRMVTDAHLLVLARRHHMRVVTFDRGLARLAGGCDVELLAA